MGQHQAALLLGLRLLVIVLVVLGASVCRAQDESSSSSSGSSSSDTSTTTNITATASMETSKVNAVGTFNETCNVTSATLTEGDLVYNCSNSTVTATRITLTFPGLEEYPNAPDSAQLLLRITFTSLYPHRTAKTTQTRHKTTITKLTTRLWRQAPRL